MTKPDDSSDNWLMNEIYPDVANIFSVEIKPLSEIRNTCLVVLDTNVLLVPYTVTKENLDEIANTYQHLAGSKRLYIPGQVAREFVRQRPQKLTELYSQLTRRKVSIKRDSYPLLESVALYQQLKDIEEELTSTVEKQNCKVDELLKHVRNWLWNDPVSKIYSRLFVDEVLFDIPFDKEELLQELERRKTLGIPPGYKDSGKRLNAAGDLLIWRTILELAKQDHKDVIFVTSEEKADWWHRSENRALYPRFELIDEFRRVSEGSSFHIPKLSELLELLGARDETVAQVGQEELQYLHDEPIQDHDLRGYIPPASECQGLVINYLSEKYRRRVVVQRSDKFPPLVVRHYNSGVVSGCSYYYLTSREGFSEHQNYINKMLSDAFFATLTDGNNDDFSNETRYSTFDVVLMTESKESAEKLYKYVSKDFVIAQFIVLHVCYLCATQDISLCGYKEISSEVN